ncbi:MAG TPA: hypothetical protein VJA22_03000 [Patescibacteria group bacterium]|nr:hypothetical protein [Patescibacteria group bacterium]
MKRLRGTLFVVLAFLFAPPEVYADFLPQYKGNSWEFSAGSVMNARESGYMDDDGKQFSFDTPATLDIAFGGLYKFGSGALRIFGALPLVKIENDPGTQWHAGLNFRVGAEKWYGSVETVFKYLSGTAGTTTDAYPFSDLSNATQLTIHYRWSKFFNSWFGYRQNIYETPLAVSMVSGEPDAPVIFTEIYENASVFDATGGAGGEFETRLQDWYFTLHAGIFLGGGALDWETRRATSVKAAFIADFSGEAGVGYQLFSSAQTRGLLWLSYNVNVHYLSGGQGDLTRNTDGEVETFRPGPMVNWLDFTNIVGVWFVLGIE